MKRNDIDLVVRSLDDSLSPREEQRLHALLHTSPEARAELEQHRQVRDLVARHGSASFGPYFADRVMRRLAKATSEDEAARPGVAAWLSSWRLAGWSLAVLLLLCTAALGYWAVPRTIHVPAGSRLTTTLPDGTSVELAPGTRLAYVPFWGRTERRVRLDGEAFFSVTHQRKPFVVETFNAEVRVLGTRFNVRAWSDDREPGTAVTLQTGRVSVVARDLPLEPVQLNPGETSLVTADTLAALPPATVPLKHALAWRQGGLAFVNQPLGSVFQALERRFDVEITLASPALADLRVTYYNPQPGTASRVLSDICHAHGLGYQRTANGFLIVAR